MRIPSFRLVLPLALVAGHVLAASAGAEEKYPARRADQPSIGANTIRATITVNPGQSIQAAVDRARPGDRVEVMPGTYREEVVIDLDAIEMAGIVIDGERPLLDGGGKLNDAMLVSGHDFTVSGFEIRNYLGNGVVVSKARNVVFRDLVTADTGKYAVYPVECQGVLVERCVSSGVWDAAVYAGQCRDVIIRDCTTFGNTIGIETENSVNVLIANNTAFDNALGILVVLLPNLPAKEMTNCRVIGNRAFDNNHENFSPPGHIVNMVQSGVGIAINAGDDVEVTGNEIRGNDSFGMTVHSLSDIIADASKLDVEPHPDRLRSHGNVFSDNGTDPAKVAKRFAEQGLAGGDIYWNGKGAGNGWKEATTRTIPEKLPVMAGAGF